MVKKAVDYKKLSEEKVQYLLQEKKIGLRAISEATGIIYSRMKQISAGNAGKEIDYIKLVEYIKHIDGGNDNSKELVYKLSSENLDLEKQIEKANDLIKELQRENAELKKEIKKHK